MVQKDRSRELRKNSTDAERTMWRILRNRRLEGFKFRRQQPLGPYIVDFICFSHRLIVEIDGGQHADQIEADAKRTEWLTEQGYRVVRFWNNDVLQNSDGVYRTILEVLESVPGRPSPSHALPRVGPFLSRKGRGELL